MSGVRCYVDMFISRFPFQVSFFGVWWCVCVIVRPSV